MWSIQLVNEDIKALDTGQGLSDYPVLVTESRKTLNAHWKTSVITTSTTTNVIEAIPNESIMLTDIVITSTKKIASSNVVVQFSDGTATETLMKLEAATAPVNFSHAFTGGIKGWKDANLQVVTDQNAMEVTVMIGYTHLSRKATLDYATWDAER
ncbi:hypothetical protein KAR91_34405 [Candidatus Pacearchaeota archaeon]|nr:hypothetical protein [Candidatus Pacearchaeota archaeon]